MMRWFLSCLVLLSAYPVAVGISRALFALANGLGLICRASSEKASPIDGAVVSFDFKTSEVCHASGRSVARGTRYRVTLSIQEAWRDASIRTDPNGFGREKMSALMWLGLPFRRVLMANWFQLVVRVGHYGFDEQPLQFANPNGDAKQFTTEFTARSDGELLMFVNDAVFGIPYIVDLFYRLNNEGNASVTIEQLP